jgi:hypothetical protein
MNTLILAGTDESPSSNKASPASLPRSIKLGHGWMLSLDGEWFRCTVQIINDGPLWFSKTAQPIPGGMSGSPIVLDNAAAIGVVCSADVSTNPGRLQRSAPCTQSPRLALHAQADA